MVTALVVGWYGRGNAGDELMKQALVAMFEPRGVDLSFVDSISERELAGASGVIFGGGSILYDKPNVTPGAMSSMLSGDVPVFYVGVGGETEIHTDHEALINASPVVAFRELDLPDLAYSLSPPASALEVTGRSGVLYVPNVEVVPIWSDPHWVHVAWEQFKNEAAQALDALADAGVPLSVMLMSDNARRADAWAAHELLGRMKRRERTVDVFACEGLSSLSAVKQHAAVITQRYHGTVMAEMAGVPYVNVIHHDKLEHAFPGRGRKLSYYGVRKDQLISALKAALNAHLEPYVAPAGTYRDVADRVVKELERN